MSGPFSQGDINGTNTIGTKDATLISSHVAGIEGYTLTGDSLARADTNNDGVVDSTDATYIQKYATNPESVKIDSVSLSGTFKFKMLTANAGGIENNLPLINDDGSRITLRIKQVCGLDMNCGDLTPAGGAHARAKMFFSSGFGAPNFVFTTT